MILDRYYEFGDPEKARDVLQKGLNLLTTFGGDGHKLLTLAIRHSNLEVLRELLKDNMIDVNCWDKGGDFGLAMAIRSDKVDVARASF